MPNFMDIFLEQLNKVESIENKQNAEIIENSDKPQQKHKKDTHLGFSKLGTPFVRRNRNEITPRSKLALINFQKVKEMAKDKEEYMHLVNTVIKGKTAEEAAKILFGEDIVLPDPVKERKEAKKKEQERLTRITDDPDIAKKLFKDGFLD